MSAYRPFARPPPRTCARRGSYIWLISSPTDRARRIAAALTALAGLLLALAALAPGAGAVIVHLRSGKTVSFQPLRHSSLRLDALFTNLDYNGGPVMPANTNYTVYWDPSGGSAYPAGYRSGVNQYFHDLAHDSHGEQNVDSVSAQYNDAAGEFANYESTFGGELLDTHPYPANGCTRAPKCLTDAQLQAELARLVAELHLPTDLTHEYFLLTPPNVESCFEESEEPECSAGAEPGTQAFCAYHSNVALPGGAELIYANDPYVTGNPGCDEEADSPNESPSDGALQGGLSHEHNESITDPEPNSAWTDFGGATGEIGDKCAEIMGEPLGKALNGSNYNQVINGHFYWYQEEWSNQGHGCMQRLKFTGERPTGSFTSVREGATTVRFDAKASTAPGGVFRFNWQFNDAPGFQSAAPLETAETEVVHTFPLACSYTVALTVLAADGTSIGTAHTIALGDGPPAAAFSVTSPAPTAGQPVSFDGSASSDPDGRIEAYVWRFGDGTGTVGGPLISHTYAAAGSYEAQLTAIDSCGLAATVAHTVTVAPAVAETGGTGAGAGTPLAVPPPPAVIATPTGTLTLLGSSLSVSRAGSSGARLACAGSAPACAGRLVLVARTRTTVGGHSRVRIVTLATGSFSILAGRSATITLRLSASGRRILRAAHGRLPAVLSIVRSSPAPTQTQTKTVRLVQRRR
jgi:PKD repeat protein